MFIESSSIDEAVCGQSVTRSGLPEEPQPCIAQIPGLQDSGESRWTRAPAGAELPGKEASLQHLVLFLHPTPSWEAGSLPGSAT